MSCDNPHCECKPGSLASYGRQLAAGDIISNAKREEWTTEQLQEEFEVLGFLAPYVVVVRKSDGAKGSLEFTHRPRVYFNFRPAS